MEVTCDDFNAEPHLTKSLEVGRGENFSVSLCANPTTGYSWVEQVEISHPDVLSQESHEALSPEESGDSQAFGTAGSQRWTFAALEPGTSTLTFEYSRPWEGGEKGIWTFTLKVLVK
jgi:inhibitor of cysteine peptidase